MCYSGSVAPFTGSSVFQECAAGNFAIHSFNEVMMQWDIMESCEESVPGYSANDTGSTDFAVCYSGYVAPFTGSSVCQDCDAGTFAGHSFKETMLCDIMESCEECAPGYLANDTRSTDCAQCSSRSVAPFMDGMKVDNDRLGQLRGLERRERRQRSTWPAQRAWSV